MRWLAANSHTLVEYGWSIQSIGRVVDILEIAFHKISKDGRLILDEEFIIDIFKPFCDELKPFKEYCVHMFDKKGYPSLQILT